MYEFLPDQDATIVAYVAEHPGAAAWDLIPTLKARGWAGNHRLTSRRLTDLVAAGYLTRTRGPRYNSVTKGPRPFRYYLGPRAQADRASWQAGAAGAPPTREE
jgi:hypothetical protein